MIADKIPEIKNLSAEDKLALATELWDEIARLHDDTVPSPAWHGEILEERRRLMESGQAVFVDWEQTKADLLRLAE